MPLNGSYFTDDGEIARRWALAGHGVVRKSAIDVVADIRAGRLVQLLPEWRSDAVPINLVCPHRSQVSERVRQLQRFTAALPALDGRSLGLKGFGLRRRGGGIPGRRAFFVRGSRTGVDVQPGEIRRPRTEGAQGDDDDERFFSIGIISQVAWNSGNYSPFTG